MDKYKIQHDLDEPISEAIQEVLEYNVTREEQKKINTSKSKTLPTLIFWFVYLAVAVIVKIILNDDIYDLQYITIVAGLATCAYIGLEYSDAFIKNRSLPSGTGKIQNIDRYAKIVYFWCGVSVVFTGAYFIFGLKQLPHVEALMISGTLSIQYVAGNKANKIATTLDKKKEDTSESDIK